MIHYNSKVVKPDCNAAGELVGHAVQVVESVVRHVENNPETVKKIDFESNISTLMK
jgi:23S rRNA maturation-related 3'-5' exoribonuclease YhaM